MLIFLIINYIFFILLCLFCFTLPGFFLLQPLGDKYNSWENLMLSTIIGFLFFTLISYILLNIQLIFLLIPIVLIIDFWSFKYLKKYKKTFSLLSRNKLIILILVFFLGILGQLLIISPSGILLNGDLVFWSSHGHDASWHIALMNQIKNGFPLQNPIFAKERLVNYHFFSDISPALFNIFFHLSSLDLYFRFFPLLFSITFGASAYFLGKRIGGNFSSGIWVTFFTYFAGSFGYIVTYLKDRTISGESLFWASQPQSSSGNPPQIIAFIIILTFLNLFFYLSNKSKSVLLMCTLLAGILVEFKSYGAIVLLISLGIVGIWQIIKHQNFTIFTLFFLSSILAVILYFPNSSNQTSFLIFEPWWFVRTLVVAPDRLNWLDLELRRQTYVAEGNWKRVLQIETMAFLIFLFGNLGMRFLGLHFIFKRFRSILQTSFNLLLVSILITSFMLPLVFLQKGVAANSIQFFTYFLLLFGILAGTSVANILGKIKLSFIKVLLSLLIIFFAVPTQIGLIYGLYSRSAFAKVTSEELSALNYLSVNVKNNEVILTPPFNKYLRSSDLTPPIWAWSDSSYVSALSQKTTYISDLEQLDIMGYQFKDRLSFQKSIFENLDFSFMKEKLLERNINYLYFPKVLAPKTDLSKSNLHKVFSNSSVEIWSAK